MKKKLLFFLILAVLFSACKLKLSENMGTVVLDLRDDSRALDADGIPILNNTRMSLRIRSSKGLEEKHYEPTEEKSWQGVFLIGETINVRVEFRTEAAVWMRELDYTVTGEYNRLIIKLSKSVKIFNNFSFSTNKRFGEPFGSSYDITFNIGGKKIAEDNISGHSFCHDNRGRTYFAYKKGRWNIKRYTSEGDEEPQNFIPPIGSAKIILSSDYKTGEIYIFADISGDFKLFRLTKDGNMPLAGEFSDDMEKYAVYDNIAIFASEEGDVQMYRIGENALSSITLSDLPNLKRDTKIVLGASYVHGEIKDLYMTSDALYVLFSTFDNNVSGNGSYYSLGGIVKYSYTADDTTGAVNHPTRIGIKNEHSEHNGIFETGEDNFYGPIKVVGFDEKNIYIADDGVKFEYKNGQVHPTANKNRIAALNRENDTLKFSDAPIGISWIGEEAIIWEGTKTKTLVWNKNRAGHGFDYYQLNSVTDSLPSDAEPFKPGEGDVSPYNYLTDVFCFDEDGNLYIVKYKKDGGGQDKYQICRFELENDGSYSKLPEIAELDFNSHTVPKVFAIAAGKSGTKNVLYYSYGLLTFYVKRLEWSGARFESASVSSEWKIERTNVGNVQTLFTSLAANQDSLFVGEVAFFDSTTQYNISVKKYPHDNPDYNNPQGIVHVAAGSLGNNDTIIISEILNALCIQDGVLYGLTSKTKIETDAEDRYILFAQSGRLFKVGNTSSFPSNGNAAKLYGNDDVDDYSDGSFTPYRFIALKSKKLVIASDGLYGAKDSNFADNKNRIWTFSLNDSGDLVGSPQSVDKNDSVIFSNELTWDSDEGTFLWE